MWWRVTTVRSLRTLGCIPSNPRDLWLFSFIKWSWICSLLIVEGTPLPPYPPRGSGTWEKQEAWLAVKAEVKNSLSSFILHISCHQFSPLASKGGTLFSAFIFWPNYLLNPFFVILYIPCQVLFQLCLGFPHPIPTHSTLYSSTRSPVTASLPVHFFLTPQFEEQICAQPCRFPAYTPG